MFFFFKQKTAYEMRISDWSSDVCSSDLVGDEIAVHFWRFRALGTEHIRGYVFKDGQMSRIATVAADVAYDDQFWQTGYTADIVDEAGRSEEHTSELQSLMRISYAVFCLKKKIQIMFTEPQIHILIQLH